MGGPRAALGPRDFAMTASPQAPWWRNFAIAGSSRPSCFRSCSPHPFASIEARLFDILSTLAPPRPPEPGVMVVAIDEPSFGEIGQRWPWPRDLHAKLVASLRKPARR